MTTQNYNHVSLKCPQCGGTKRRIVDIRPYTDAKLGMVYIIRRNLCIGCDRRETTYEVSVHTFEKLKVLMEHGIEISKALEMGS